MRFVIGGRGRLGQALMSDHSPQQITALDRSIYSEWTQDNATDGIKRFFERVANAGDVVYVASGITDPGAPADEHFGVNFTLPRNVINATSQLGLKVITFGTIMEEIVGDRADNPYYLSKVRLGRYIDEQAAKGGTALHLRVHTLYGGGPPAKFMFLGQFLDAVRAQRRFGMSAGDQLREYHHVVDEVRAVAKIVASNAIGSVNLSHGAPVRLRDLARYLARRFDCEDNLDIGAFPSSPLDNYDRVFECTPILKDINFRETFASVFDYMETWHKNSQES